MNTSISDIRERANSVLDGMTAHRQRVARDCLLLCDEVQRLRTLLAQQDSAKENLFDTILGKGNR
ncbi:MAG: hypothetical protein HZT39_09725 [Pseudoxanthomonas sp.]|nr:MAG: hypothetical protein HZT39_09725 [Pseudoxanthomonas sp.]